MTGYWVRHRLLPTIILCIVSAMIVGLLFAFPYIVQQADAYQARSVYCHSTMDFIAPEPSYQQVAALPGKYGIGRIFPFYLSKMQVSVNGASRNTTVLLSDRFQNLDITMYNHQRLIEQSPTELDNPVLVDWQFCHDTHAKIGDTVTITIGGTAMDYRIYGIYEPNSIYDGGAILAEISPTLGDAISANSKSSGYSGMYIEAEDYAACRAYLTTDYRPLGRLKDRQSFQSDEQYQIHYDAIMSSGYGNEITDFRIREGSARPSEDSIMIWLGAVLAGVLSVGLNLVLTLRGCEKVYFSKHCIPKGKNVKPYYRTTFIFDILFHAVLFGGILLLKLHTADIYIPRWAVDGKLLAIPGAVIIAELANLVVNNCIMAGASGKAKHPQK